VDTILADHLSTSYEGLAEVNQSVRENELPLGKKDLRSEGHDHDAKSQVSEKSFRSSHVGRRPRAEEF
jgi:hypothetical protein